MAPLAGPSSGAPGTSTPSPRSRNRSRPLPFITMPPPSSFSQFDSRPHSPTYHRNAVLEVQSVLYGGRNTSREQIAALVNELYDENATFENPLTLAKGRQSICEMFALLALVPGAMHSELGDVAEAHGYDGVFMAVMQHTLHIAFMPFLDPDAHLHYSSPHSSMHRSFSFFSLPATPYAQNSPPATGGIFSKTRPAGVSRYPLSRFLGKLSPRNIASTLTTVHLKLHTKLVFNEQGKVIEHEDTWGLKEIVEGVFPILGTVYALQRQGMAYLGGMASRSLLGAGQAQQKDEQERKKKHNGGGGGTHDCAVESDDGGAGMAPISSTDLDEPLYPAGSPMSTRKHSMSGFQYTAKRSDALRLDTGDLARELARHRQPTTMVDDDSS
ncbi:hypothetical protein OIV83_000738 [Microbotryomycetes sp. JL201]|nr:hypothetical protein OIV83_000738 [Microbotryomycetes sp. JL201]